MNLLALDILTLDRYFELRDEYIERNLYLYIFQDFSPRTFGELWAQGKIRELIPTVCKPSKSLDAEFFGTRFRNAKYTFDLESNSKVGYSIAKLTEAKKPDVFSQTVALDSLAQLVVVNQGI